MSISPIVRQAWQCNTRVNRIVLDHLTPAMLSAEMPGGDVTVAAQLAHITGTTKYWGMNFAPSLAALPDLASEDGEQDSVVTDLARIRIVVTDTASDVIDAAESATDKGTLPHADVEAYLIHMMVHDAHHRGQILLALKTAGHPMPDEDAMWGPWRGE